MGETVATASAVTEREAFDAARRALVELARENVNTFIELCLRDDTDGSAVVQQPFHEEWHRLAEEHDRLVVFAGVELGKTQQLSIARTVWLLGRDPTLRVAIVSNAHHQAAKMLRAIAKYIASDTVREVFPNLRPSTPWSPDGGQLTIERPFVSKDPSVQALGCAGNILGARLDICILDDVLDYENCRTEEQRVKLIEWYKKTLAGRMTARGKVLCVGVAHHLADLLHNLAQTPGWKSARFPVEDAEGNSIWPERWSAKRIADRRLELGPAESARQLDVQARSDEDARFKTAWIDAALARGKNKTLLRHLFNRPPDSRVFIGVDLGVSQKSTADLTAIATVLVYANGTRELLGLESGRWDAPTILDRIERTWRGFNANVVMIETVAAQDHLRQFLRSRSAIPIRGFKTAAGKASLQWAAEQLAVELDNGKWILPSDAAGRPIGEVAALCKDILFYQPAPAHVGDRLAALLFARHAAGSVTKAETFRFDTISR